MKRLLCIIALLCLGASCARAQEARGDAAREVRSQRANQPHAKIIVDDEHSPLKKSSPFPEIALRGLDNSGDICRSMESYRMQHSSEEFEQAVHDWYDEYDQLVGRYLREQALTRDRQGDDDSYSDRDYDDYGQLLRRRADEAERRRLASSAKHDS